MIRILAFLMASPALAQVPCGDPAQVTKMLAEKYGESPLATGQAGGSTMLTWVNRETGTWTITVTRPDGVMCIMGGGEGFAAVAPEPAGTLN